MAAKLTASQRVADREIAGSYSSDIGWLLLQIRAGQWAVVIEAVPKLKFWNSLSSLLIVSY
jgi:hypothetical protein